MDEDEHVYRSLDEVLPEIKEHIDSKGDMRSFYIAIGKYRFELTVTPRDDAEYVFDINACITFTYTPPAEGAAEGAAEGKLHLDYYYYNEGCTTQIMPHGVFFKFLDRIAETLGVPEITLEDYSSKDFDVCRMSIPVWIFALANRPTFYSRYSFENPQFDAHIARIRKQTILEFVLSNRTSYRYMPMGKRTRSMSKYLRENYAPFNENTTVQEVADFVVKTCSHGFKKLHRTPRLKFHHKLVHDIDRATSLLRLLMMTYQRNVGVGISTRKLGPSERGGSKRAHRTMR